MTLPWSNRLALLFVLLTGCTGAVSELRAEPLAFSDTYFLIDSTPQRLDLFSNQGAVLEARTYDGTLPLSLVFATFVNNVGGEPFTDIVQFTYQEQGAAPLVFSQAFQTGGDAVRFIFPVLFEPIRRTGAPIPTTLTVDLLNSSPDFTIPAGPNQGRQVDSFTYSFSTLAPVPEPSSVMLVLGGLSALAGGRRYLYRGRSGGAWPRLYPPAHRRPGIL